MYYLSVQKRTNTVWAVGPQQMRVPIVQIVFLAKAAYVSPSKPQLTSAFPTNLRENVPNVTTVTILMTTSAHKSLFRVAWNLINPL